MEVLLLALVIAIPFFVHAGLLNNIFSNKPLTAEEAILPVLDNPVDIQLLAANQNPNLAARGGADILVEDDALVSTGPVGADEIAAQSANSGEIKIYTVRHGDSLSEVAQMFGVTTNTIMWANDLTKATAISPGDTLVILPIAGVRHVVKTGDTISSVAKKYDGDVDEILSYNQLASASEIKVGDTVIIPGGLMHKAVVAPKVATPNRTSGGSATGGISGFSHPAPGAIKTQGIHGYNAVDLAGSGGTAIRAAAAGEVIVARTSGWNGGYGNYIVVKHSNGVQTLYAHLSSLNVGVGDYVAQGETIGGMGNSGRSTGTHLHFEVRGARNPF